MGETSNFIRSSFVLGLMLCGVGLLISVPRKMHTLVLVSALAPVLVPLCISGFLLAHHVSSLCTSRVHDGDLYTNTSRDTTFVTVEIPAPQPHDPRNITGINIDESLLAYFYDKEAVEGSPEECPICRELYEKGDEIVRVPVCTHPFHKKCIMPWLEKQQTCPVCRCRVDLEISRDVSLIID